MRREHCLRHPRRALALLLGAMIALSLPLFAAFALAEQHHDCAGEHCEICAAIAHAAALFRADAGAFLPVCAALAALFAVCSALFAPRPADVPARSPVSLKVKLSD